MFPPSARWFSLVVLLLFLLAPARPTLATPPDESRPYIELPFPRGEDYVVTCGYECYQHKGSMSHAVDFAIPVGAPIVAAAPGAVMAVTWEVGLPAGQGLGDALILYIDHGEGWFTRYVHLDGVTVEVGDVVQMGQIIGYSGKTGTKGAHLHFELKYGGSLHSPSVPIDELFDGQPPMAGEQYLSNNAGLEEAEKLLAWQQRPSPTPPPAAPEPLALPASPAIAQAFEHRLPQVEGGLALSHSAIEAGASLTASFTLRNQSDERLHLAMLGVGTRLPGAAAPASSLGEAFFFDRSIVLNPGRAYHFSAPYRFDQAGEVELFIFALGPENEWIPLAGADQVAPLTIHPAPVRLYLPLLLNQPRPALPLLPAAPLE